MNKNQTFGEQLRFTTTERDVEVKWYVNLEYPHLDSSSIQDMLTLCH